ncbi:uncharacterized protein [Arachis hypogaea]|uniref:uncharacterized protein n=1 Tax=Arachis hypogaea TaxID=3818 RepID=UPI000DEC98FA|nr:uncharacterized protein LOC112803280 [Arachis hypogaea]
MSFVKTVDASDVIKTANALFNLFADVIEWVEPSNIVHVVTDNAANYVSAGKLIHEKYPNTFWSPCAAHCINFILKDITSIPHIADLTSRASKVTVIYDRKEDLQALMVDKYFTSHKLVKSANRKIVSSIVLDSKFWQNCVTTVKIVGPLIKLLRLVDADEKPSLGIMYEGIKRAKNSIKIMFRNRKAAYTPYTSILKMRWYKHLKRDLHAAAYFLNPDIFYSEGFVEKANVLRSLLDFLDVEILCDDSVAAMQEIQLYRNCKEIFGMESSKRAASRLELVSLLHQTSSSFGCERNWSFFEQIHSKRRNRLEHQRLSDIVYVTYNLRLQSRLHRKKRNYDPIDIQSIDTVDFWVMTDEDDPEFINGDVEGIEKV